ncbi:MAG: hypothetical protein K9K82_13430 [Desulfobacteraceae bacterium]|nr:hypothetical protein [Desulfobacteraceae bacterium]
MASENDIVLIYHEDQPLVFARVEDIQPDVKKDWYHIKLMLLQLPVQVVTWILKDDYINGSEFTMGGQRMRLEKVTPPEPEENPPQEHEEENSREESVGDESGPEDSREEKVISLKNRKPKSE